MKRLDNLNTQRLSLIAQLDNCWRINEYKDIKSRLHLIDREIAIESGEFERYSLVIKINERKDFISRAITKAEELLSPKSEMMGELMAKNDFKFNSGKGSDVCERLILCPVVSPIYFYKPLNPWTMAMGYSRGGEIFLNSRKFDSLKFSDVVGFLLHEYSHVAGFGHDGNFKTQEKINFSVPYYLSENAARFL